MTIRIAAIASICALAACTGKADFQGREGAAADDAEGPVALDAAPLKLRHLTADQYANTMSELLRVSSVDVQLVREESDIVSQLAAEKVSEAADALVKLDAHAAQVPCDVASGDDACAAKYIDSFGARAFRRPLSDEERSWLNDVYAKARAQWTFKESIDVVTRVILQAPQLFYLYEEGKPGDGELRALTGYERASRLSYFLWNSMPDDALLNAAGKGELDTADGVKVQARRMLADPRAKTTVQRFFSEWLELNGNEKHPSLEEVNRDPAKFPNDSPALRAGMRKEVEALAARMLEGAGLSWMLTTTEAYVNGALAKHYGVVGGPTTDDTFAWVRLDQTQRAGLFTRGAFLTLNALPEAQSPIRRGAFLVKNAFCEKVGPPPPNVNDVPGDKPTTTHLTTRMLTELRTAPVTCQGCHANINPAGFGLENYDAIGGWQTSESGTDTDGTPWSVPVDASGQFKYTDVDAPFVGPVALSQAMAQSRMVHDCFSERYFQAAMGHAVDNAHERGWLQHLQNTFAANDDVKELLVELTGSAPFLYGRAEGQP